MGYGKPVLYFHLAAESPEMDLSAEVLLGDMFQVAEHYPPGTLSPDRRTLRWNVHLARGACSGERTYPDAASPACRLTSDGYCETAELAHYETADASCLRVDDAEWPLLFYRGSSPRDEVADATRLPLQVRVDDSGAIELIRSPRASATIGRVWHLQDKHVRALVDWPAPGASAQVPSIEAPADPRALMRAELESHGLTSDEIGAFGRAWFDELFGPAPQATADTPSTGERVLDGAGRGGGEVGVGYLGLVGRGRSGSPGQPDNVLLYWLPGEELDSVARLSFEPTPREVHRATLVRVYLGS
ncbi:MAG: hypothetical protein DRJ42_30920 [Deltaproteobacteria bacterium]|nr:MAG: hypothetical protein DRJ42_30920 [Deltaproteobacteria bacterium]